MKAIALENVCAAILVAGFSLSSNVDVEVDQGLEHFERGAEYHLSGNNDMAIKEFKKSLFYNKKSANTHYYLSLVYALNNKISKAIEHMLKAEKYFEAEGREYWKERSRKRIEEYYLIFGYKKEDFEK